MYGKADLNDLISKTERESPDKEMWLIEHNIDPVEFREFMAEYDTGHLSDLIDEFNPPRSATFASGFEVGVELGKLLASQTHK